MLSGLSRTPHIAVRRQLRREVGFGCPAGQCNSPYLEYHHFDPSWAECNHHNPDGMIALCPIHHAKADAWTIEQVRELKTSGKARQLVGRFEWMRDDILTVAGGNYYYETPVILAHRGIPLISYKRDERGRMLLNLRMLSLTGEPRARLIDNDWIVEGDPLDVDCPTSGSRLAVRYENGDAVKVQFREWRNESALRKKFPVAMSLGSGLRYPLVTAEVGFAVGGTDLNFSASQSSVPGKDIFRNCVFNRVGVAINLG